jgi:hypothetical protein
VQLGILRTGGSARRIVIGAVTMAVAGVGLTAVNAHGSGAAVPSGVEQAVPVEALVPDPALVGSPEPSTTTTTVPPEPPTTTTTAAPAEPPTTAPPATTTTTVAPARVEASAGPSRQAQIEAIADGSGWNWRSAGVRLTVGFLPEDCCHWGVYESKRRTVWIGPTAFDNPARLRYVVLHELAHAWQYGTGRFTELIADYQPWGRSTPAEALEAGGDCIATLWGATDHHYWQCPAARPADRRPAPGRRLDLRRDGRRRLRLEIFPVEGVGLGVLHDPGHLGDEVLVVARPVTDVASSKSRCGETILGHR